MTTQANHDSSNVITFVARRRDSGSTGLRAGSVVLPFDAKRSAVAPAPVVDVDAWYHQAEVDAARPH